MTKSHEWMSEEERKELEVGKYKSAPTFKGVDNLGSFPPIIRFIRKNLTLNDIDIMLFWRAALLNEWPVKKTKRWC